MNKHFAHWTSQTAGRRCGVAVIAAAVVLLGAVVSSAVAQEQIMFPAVQDAHAVLLQKIRNERVRIDVGIWILGDGEIVQTLINKFTIDKVPVRVLGDRAIIFETDPDTRRSFEALANAGIPIRLRYNPNWYPEILHWKATIFAGQGMVEFGSANYTVYELKPWSATEFKDESVMFTDDPQIVNAFRTKFDQFWVDTEYFKDWKDVYLAETGITWTAPMTIPRGRQEQDYPTNIPGMIWGQGAELNSAIVAEIDRETRGVDMMFYRLTVPEIAAALIRKHAAGVPVRVITEPTQYRNDKWPEFWLVGAMVDRLIAAGIPVKQRLHQGLTHIKGMITSNVALNASSNFANGWERDHNYFISSTTKPLLYSAYRQRFDEMWRDGVNYGGFQQKPPYPPTQVSPANAAVEVPTRTRLEWKRAPFATSFDVYLGTSPETMTPMRVNAQMDENPPDTYTFTPTRPLVRSKVYYWKVVSRTLGTDANPSLSASSEIWSFRTTAVGRGNGDSGGTHDFDGDGVTDVATFRPSEANWYIRYSSSAPMATQWGQSGDLPVAADYDGDGWDDIAVYRPRSGQWFLLRSMANNAQWDTIQWGATGDIPVPADYDGDGRTDIATYRPGFGRWSILTSSSGFTAGTGLFWGAGNDQPVRGDFDGDGKADPSVYRPSSGQWLILLSTTSYQQWLTEHWGSSGDVPVTGDYDGDGRTDMAVYRPSTGTWYVLTSSSRFSGSARYGWGAPGDVPVGGDFDGDAVSDIAVYRPGTAQWLVLKSSSGFTAWNSYAWGQTEDVPIGGFK